MENSITNKRDTVSLPKRIVLCIMSVRKIYLRLSLIDVIFYNVIKPACMFTLALYYY